MKRCQPPIFCFFLLLLIIVPAAADEDDTETGHISGEIFSKKGKWCHTYISISEAYNDNIFNSENNKECDYIIVISPGVQFTVPGTGQNAEDIITNTNTPGGLVFGRFGNAFFRRFRVYLGYAPRFHLYKNNTDEDIVTHNVQAGAQYNLRGGLSFNAVNRYVKYYDQNEADTSTRTDKYSSNLFNLMATYTLSGRIQLRADYSNFRLDYTEGDINNFRDRTDNAGAGFIFFRFRSKTAIFIEYRYIDIDYQNDNARDSDDQIYLAGIVRNITAKTRGSFRAGYGVRRYADPTKDDNESAVFEGDLSYVLSSKTSIKLGAFHRKEESSDATYDYTITTAVSLGYAQNLTRNLNFNTDFTYNHYDYKSGAVGQAGGPDKKDDLILITPSLAYDFRRGLSASLAYTYRERDSGIDLDSYTGNTVILKITGSI